MNIIPLVTLVGGTPQTPEVFLPGQAFTVDPGEGKRLVDSKLAVDSGKPSGVTDSNELIESLVDAIAELPTSGFAKDGKPNVKTLQHILGCDVSATQRDQAWEKFQQLSQGSPTKKTGSS